MKNFVKLVLFLFFNLASITSCSFMGFGDQTPYLIELDNVTSLGIGLDFESGNRTYETTEKEYIILSKKSDGTILPSEIKNKIGQSIEENIRVSAFNRISKRFYVFTIVNDLFRYIIDIETGLIYPIGSSYDYWTYSPNMTSSDMIIQGIFPTDSDRLYLHLNQTGVSNDQVFKAEILENLNMEITSVTPDTFSVNGFIVTPKDILLAKYESNFITKTKNSELSYYTLAPFQNFNNIILDKTGNIFIVDDYFYEDPEPSINLVFYLVSSTDQDLTFSEVYNEPGSTFPCHGVHLLNDGGLIWFDNYSLIKIAADFSISSFNFGYSLEDRPIDQLIVKDNLIFAVTTDNDNPIIVIDLTIPSVNVFPLDSSKYQVDTLFNNSESSSSVFAVTKEILTGSINIYELDSKGTMELVNEKEPENIVIYINPLSYQ